METENEPGTFVFQIMQGDIALLDIRDGIIVNPSNTGLILNRSVSDSIARHAGPDFQQKMHTKRSQLPQNRLELGRVIETEPGLLHAKYVLHVSIIGKNAVDKKLIMNSLINCFDRAERLEATAIAFPPLGVGVGKFPFDEFLSIFYTIVLEELPRSESLLTVVLCLDENEFAQATKHVEENKDQVPPNVTIEFSKTAWTGAGI